MTCRQHKPAGRATRIDSTPGEHHHFSDCCRIKHSIIISDSIGIKPAFANLWNTIIVLVSFVSMFVRQ